MKTYVDIANIATTILFYIVAIVVAANFFYKKYRRKRRRRIDMLSPTVLNSEITVHIVTINERKCLKVENEFMEIIIPDVQVETVMDAIYQNNLILSGRKKS